MKFPRSVYYRQQLFIEFVSAFQPETHQTHFNLIAKLKPLISQQQTFESFGQSYVASDVGYEIPEIPKNILLFPI